MFFTIIMLTLAVAVGAAVMWVGQRLYRFNHWGVKLVGALICFWGAVVMAAGFFGLLTLN